MSRLLDTIRVMAVAMARLENRQVEAETPTKASHLKHVPPLPPPPIQFPHIPIASPIVGLYEIQAPGMPVGVLLPIQFDSQQMKMVRQRQFVIRKFSSSQGLEHHHSREYHHSRECRDVNHFLKNGGRLIYGSTDPVVALEWIDTT